MFWAVLRERKRTNLVAMKGDPDLARGGVIARQYIEVLKEYLPTILDFDSLFMQDNTSIHTAYIVQD
jgi:transposase